MAFLSRISLAFFFFFNLCNGLACFSALHRFLLFFFFFLLLRNHMFYDTPTFFSLPIVLWLVLFFYQAFSFSPQQRESAQTPWYPRLFRCDGLFFSNLLRISHPCCVSRGRRRRNPLDTPFSFGSMGGEFLLSFLLLFSASLRV